MKHRLLIFAMAAIAAALIIAGCTTTTKSGNGQDSRLLLKDTFEKFTLQLDPKNNVQVNMTTDGAPVDVLLLDAPAFDSYTGAVNGSGASWSTLASRLNTNAANFSYAVNTGGTYYIVVDNTGMVPGGAGGASDVFVNVNWSFS
jgi:predicted small secreted protein